MREITGSPGDARPRASVAGSATTHGEAKVYCSRVAYYGGIPDLARAKQDKRSRTGFPGAGLSHLPAGELKSMSYGPMRGGSAVPER